MVVIGKERCTAGSPYFVRLSQRQHQYRSMMKLIERCVCVCVCVCAVRVSVVESEETRNRKQVLLRSTVPLRLHPLALARVLSGSVPKNQPASCCAAVPGNGWLIWLRCRLEN